MAARAAALAPVTAVARVRAAVLVAAAVVRATVVDPARAAVRRPDDRALSVIATTTAWIANDRDPPAAVRRWTNALELAAARLSLNGPVL